MTATLPAQPGVPFSSRPAAPVNQAERPLLARVAESIFWCARYTERAEHVARTLWVTSQVAIDVGDLDLRLRSRLWLGLLEMLEMPPPADDDTPLADRVIRYLLTDADTPASAVSSIAHARENARGVRGEISAEMWQTLNELYWSLEGAGRGEGARQMLADSAEGLFQHFIRGSMQFQGVTDQTLAHGQRWDFALAGRLLERADATCRIIQARVRFLEEAGRRMETPLRNIQLMAALRMCGSIEAYRRQHLNKLDVRQVAGFLLLQADHPRSVRFAVESTHRAVRRIHQASQPGQHARRGDGLAASGVDAAERVLGRLAARLEYAEVADIAAEGIDAFLAEVRIAVAEANRALHGRYFMG